MAKKSSEERDNFEESPETQVTQNYTAWASHIIEEYQRGLKDGRRSAANQLKEWAESQTNVADPYAHMIVGKNPADAYKFLIAKCDDLLKEKP